MLLKKRLKVEYLFLAVVLYNFCGNTSHNFSELHGHYNDLTTGIM